MHHEGGDYKLCLDYTHEKFNTSIKYMLYPLGLMAEWQTKHKSTSTCKLMWYCLKFAQIHRIQTNLKEIRGTMIF